MERRGQIVRKPKFLCLHGFRTSGEIFKKQLGKWPESVPEKIELVFVDAPFPAQGESDVEGILDPPYYEWFQFNKEFTEYTNFNESLAYIEDCMIKYGPFDGLLGFSQGAILSAALPGLQKKGVALMNVPRIRFLIIIGGATLKEPSLAEKAYLPQIECPSIHFIGETDYFLKDYGTELLKAFIDPVVIHHPKGHIVPRIGKFFLLRLCLFHIVSMTFTPPRTVLSDEKSLPIMLSFLDKIQIMANHREKANVRLRSKQTAEYTNRIHFGRGKQQSQRLRMGSELPVQRKPRFLCLHGFRTSGEILRTQMGKWPQTVLDKIDLVFLDAPLPCQGKSEVEGIFDPPYYEWFQFNKEFTEYTNFDECLTYIEDCAVKHGPIDGLLGFSQGAILSAALPGLQAKVGFGSYEGETDFLKPYGIELLESFVDPLVIHHPKGHTIPRLDEKGSEDMLNFLEKIQKVDTMEEEEGI
ncbi:hypothetical protein RJ639_039644 [Escallonia herrerae]|uniref:Serine hydrolase domain-containing protein n=1 Tax=Escallonia herrerae TaxID=1293975 RepID=A0AA89BAN6_9ASTE|nr:hypothetical protein RJ639_039644 [Escallonia herrerae]